MPSKEEKRRRAKIVEEIVAKDTADAIEKMPISFKDLGALFNHLDEVFGNEGCDHTLKITTAFLENRKLNKEKIILWLGEHGGYCDCEVLANVEESWESEIEKNTSSRSFGRKLRCASFVPHSLNVMPSMIIGKCLLYYGVI